MPIEIPGNSELRDAVSSYKSKATIKKYGPIGEWKFGDQVTDMSSLFFRNYGFNEDISDWDVSRVTNMDKMFRYAHSFNQDISRWNVGQVTNMRLMFEEAKSFNQDLSGWNVGQVTNMDRMFRRALVFNGDITSWNVGQVTNMNQMFTYADKFNQDISSWDVRQVTDMREMFRSTDLFNQDISSWDVGQVKYMNFMFEDTDSFNQDLSSWDVRQVTNMSYMFRDAAAFNQDISGWDVGQVTDMSFMFEDAVAFNQDISGWDVGQVTNMKSMFENAQAFNQDLSGWNVGQVTNMQSMFQDAVAFNQDISRWDVSSVTNMAYMFQNAKSFNQDLSLWDVSSVTDIRYMFQDALAFNADLSCWDVSSVIISNGGIQNTFYGASRFDGDSIQSWPLNLEIERRNEINASNMLTNTFNALLAYSNFNYYSWFMKGSTYIGCIDDIEVKLIPGTNQIDVVWDDPKMITRLNSSLVFDLNFNGDTQTNLTSLTKRQKTLGVGRYTVKYITINPVSGVDNIKSFTILVKEDLTATSCFTADAVIKTDQGLLPIKDITTNHTIHKKMIKGVSKTTYSQNKLIAIAKHAFGKNMPNKKTLVAPFHRFSVDGCLKAAVEFVNNDSIYLTNYKQETLYNVILETQETMEVNNLVAETLDPNTLVAKLFDGSMSEHQRAKVVKSLNAYHANLKAKPNKRLKDYRV